MQRPRKAFILAAGFGERLNPMTLTTPKALMPVWNKPFLAHLLDRLESWQVAEVVVNTHYLASLVQEWIVAYTGPIKVTFSHEPNLLGTGGALRPIQQWLGDDPFWMINADIAWDADPESLMTAFEQSRGFCATWLESKKGPRTVEMDFAGRITNYQSPTPGTPHTYTLCGVHLLSPKVLQYLPKDQISCSIVDAWQEAMFANHFVRGVVQPKAYWNDGGTLSRYISIHRETQKLNNAYYADHASLPDQRLDLVCKALDLESSTTIMIPMGHRESNRTFWRLITPRKSLMVVFYDAACRENGRYVATTQCLSEAGVSVPKLFWAHPRHHIVVLQDLGDASLEGRVTEAFDKASNSRVSTSLEVIGDTLHLKEVAELLAAFHAVKSGRMRLESPMNEALLREEHDLYAEYWGAFSNVQCEQLSELIRRLLLEPQVLIHRDYQSSNIIFHQAKPYTIDYQGMRKGPAVYDLASLIYDPYVCYSQAQQTTLIQTYCIASGYGISTIEDVLPYAGIQRLLYVLGTFKRLESTGQERFRPYISVARETLTALCQKTGLTALIPCE